MTFIYAYDNSVSATVLGIFIVLGVGCFWAFSEFVTNVFTALFLPKRRARLEARRLEQQAIGKRISAEWAETVKEARASKGPNPPPPYRR